MPSRYFTDEERGFRIAVFFLLTGAATSTDRGVALAGDLNYDPRIADEEPMIQLRTFRQKIIASFAIVALLALVTASVGIIAARSAATSDERTMYIAALAAAALATTGASALFAWMLASMLKTQVGSAVETIQSSSTALSSAARQQAASSKELAATTVEIATTTRELLAMSRQISQSARRAAETAEEAGERARSGDLSMERAKEAISGIQRQMVLIVDRMRSLGSKSERVGGILELINDLAEQTNILAINATIEAASAGPSGKRFAVVAAEIRRLADRVGGSAREIHGLLEEIRKAAGATVTATDDGSKAVESGTSQFGEVLSTFKHITDRARVTAEVAREIELSIQQQTTAVEQVNHAIGEVSYATQESESSCQFTLETSEQLATLSETLATLVVPGRQTGDRTSMSIPPPRPN